MSWCFFLFKMAGKRGGKARAPKGSFIGSNKQDVVSASNKFSKYLMAGGSDYAESLSRSSKTASFDMGDGADIFLTSSQRADVVTGGPGADYFFLESSVKEYPGDETRYVDPWRQSLTIKDYDPLLDGGVFVKYGTDVTLNESNSRVVTSDASGGLAIDQGIQWIYETSSKSLCYVLWNADLSGIESIEPLATFEAGLAPADLISGKIRILSEASFNAAYEEAASSLGFVVA